MNWVDPFGLARRQERPLDIPGFRNTTNGPFHHDSFKYDDGTDSGYYDDSTVKSDDAPEKIKEKYTEVGEEFDDETLRQAEENVKNNWDKNSNPNAPDYDRWDHNCQDYCDAVEEEYNRLKEEKAGSKECR